MPDIRIVTDSGAFFANAAFVEQHDIVVIPNQITIGGRLYREGVDLSNDEAIRLIANLDEAPVVTPPSQSDYYNTYKKLVGTCDAVLSIHPSRRLSGSWDNAQRAARQFAGSCPVFAIDSQSLSAGQGMLIRVAVQSVDTCATVDAVVRSVRGAVDRIYSVYYLESVRFLSQNQILSASHALLGALLGIKPFLAMENGQLTPIEKVRTRAQAIDRLVEFVTEFGDIHDVVILQNRQHATEQTRLIQERLALEYPGMQFPHALYGPSLAALLGTEATGIVVLEHDTGELQDEF